MSRRAPLLLLLPILLAPAAPAWAQAPEKPGPAPGAQAPTAAPVEPPPPAAPPAAMTKIVVRSAIERPGKSLEEEPKTLYRAGERWGRIEHPKNPKTGVHPIVIVASPEAWFVDRAKKTAEHFRDPGPTFRFRAPIVDPAPGLPNEALEALEFGREFAFLEAHGAQSRREESGGKKAEIHSVELEGITVEVSAKPDTRQPAAVVVRQDRKILAAYRYQEYREGLRTDPKLFEPPKGFRVVEAGPERAKKR